MRKPNEAVQGQLQPPHPDVASNHTTDQADDSHKAQEAINVAQSPTVQPSITPAAQSAILSAYYDRLTWGKSSIKEVKYNPAIQEWINFDQGFANWVRSCIMLHSDNSLDETVCTIPDQWRGDIGDKITIVTANYIPVRVGTTHKFKAGVYHVMN